MMMIMTIVFWVEELRLKMLFVYLFCIDINHFMLEWFVIDFSFNNSMIMMVYIHLITQVKVHIELLLTDRYKSLQLLVWVNIED
jgi:hypothetical protein